MKLSQQEQGILLLSARETIFGLFDNEIPQPEIDYNAYPRLAQKVGAFVTLHLYDELRGCIGYIISESPLFETVCEAARLAATSDPRFPPVTKIEMHKILIEISVLSQPVPIGKYEEIEIGKHGLILEELGGRGVLLPQVATENNFDTKAFLTALCRKAGLDPYLWQTKKLNIKSFTAQIFAEEKHWNLTGESI